MESPGDIAEALSIAAEDIKSSRSYTSSSLVSEETKKHKQDATPSLVFEGSDARKSEGIDVSLSLSTLLISLKACTISEGEGLLHRFLISRLGEKVVFTSLVTRRRKSMGWSRSRHGPSN